jgi:hypothetical protein
MVRGVGTGMKMETETKMGTEMCGVGRATTRPARLELCSRSRQESTKRVGVGSQLFVEITPEVRTDHCLVWLGWRVVSQEEVKLMPME